ncbi:MAG: hypothetical protein MUO68_04240, partial [Desulfobacteraceae bacterium]|nr:hypothetical protein [Desulfobacteraceae bacterium]
LTSFPLFEVVNRFQERLIYFELRTLRWFFIIPSIFTQRILCNRALYNLVCKGEAGVIARFFVLLD